MNVLFLISILGMASIQSVIATEYDRGGSFSKKYIARLIVDGENAKVIVNDKTTSHDAIIWSGETENVDQPPPIINWAPSLNWVAVGTIKKRYAEVFDPGELLVWDADSKTLLWKTHFGRRWSFRATVWSLDSSLIGIIFTPTGLPEFRLTEGLNNNKDSFYSLDSKTGKPLAGATIDEALKSLKSDSRTAYFKSIRFLRNDLMRAEVVISKNKISFVDMPLHPVKSPSDAKK